MHLPYLWWYWKRLRGHRNFQKLYYYPPSSPPSPDSVTNCMVTSQQAFGFFSHITARGSFVDNLDKKYEASCCHKSSRLLTNREMKRTEKLLWQNTACDERINIDRKINYGALQMRHTTAALHYFLDLLYPLLMGRRGLLERFHRFRRANRENSWTQKRLENDICFGCECIFGCYDLMNSIFFCILMEKFLFIMRSNFKAATSRLQNHFSSMYSNNCHSTFMVGFYFMVFVTLNTFQTF